MLFKSNYHRDEVFVAGGQPSVTYIQREDQHIERNLARAIATPNQIVSLAGTTKTGKTVLCRRVLGQREYVWVDGGQHSNAGQVWEYVSSELKLPIETAQTTSTQATATLQGSIPLIATAGGSLLSADSITERRKIDSMSAAIATMLKDKIVLVIDDFHYLDSESRREVMRNVKGGVFNGLKVVLLSVTHRAFDAIKAESELTGRFVTIKLPHWSLDDLKEIAVVGFKALNVTYPEPLISRLCKEAQENPFLMQKFCWEICFDLGIERTALLNPHKIPTDYNPESMFERLAEDAGLPIYQQLAAGPQSRKVRAKRPLKSGEKADIYQVLLLALAETGPKAAVSYEELRTALSDMLTDMVPQKHEITSALRHLSAISRKIGAESAIDWDEEKREINIADPYLRFYLRWRLRHSRVNGH
ncbi:MAG TPA: TniB family NTP-binding protein [Rhizomicrobium sp.]|jgi:archaellum biogenesis ATPase FlaH|nr:TniB family NTP-binding protein [Rhizomicrobium sp.]